MSDLPTISIVTVALNSNLHIFKKVLESIKMQDFPKRLIEHIVMDGGSTNGSIELAKSYGCKVFVYYDGKREQIRPALGIKKAKGKVILILESDNILIGKDWLSKMTKPFIENKKIFCTYSIYNGYEKNMSASTKYLGFFGVHEPTLYYLNKTEKISLIKNKYDIGEIIKEKKDYYVVKFNKDNLPPFGDNGHMVLSSAIKKMVKDPKKYIHTDAFAQLNKSGYQTFGAVKNKMIHVQNSNLINFMKRRVEIKKDFYDAKRGKRKYLVMNWNSKKDVFNLIKYVILSITIVVPMAESIRGYIKIRDKAWFLHPILCLLMVSGYGFSEISWKIKSVVDKK